MSASATAAARPAPSLTLLLAPLTRGLVGAEQPAFLARLERLAAQRYRAWADESPAHAPVLLACAAREEEIAARAERLFPMRAAQAEKLDALAREAARLYAALFVGLTLHEQLRLQAEAERQGAGVWRALCAALSPPADVQEALGACARLEEESAERLDALLGSARS